MTTPDQLPSMQVGGAIEIVMRKLRWYCKLTAPYCCLQYMNTSNDRHSQWLVSRE